MKKLLFSALCLTFASAALADEVDFYQFRTAHSPNANHAAKFKLEVLETNAVDSGINNDSYYKCTISPAAPEQFSCNVRGTALRLRNDEASARLVLATTNGVRADEVLEIKSKEAGVYQALLKNDRIFHVVMTAPTVVDDSMECEWSVMSDKLVGMVRCRSEFYPEKSFMVRDIPVVTNADDFVIFGAPTREDYEDNDAWAKKNETALSKIHDVLTYMSELKKISLVSDMTSTFNFALAKNDSIGLLQTNARVYYSYGTHINGTGVSGLELRGSIQHIHRGLQGRRGD